MWVNNLDLYDLYHLDLNWVKIELQVSSTEYNEKNDFQLQISWKNKFTMKRWILQKKNQFYDFISTSKRANKTRSIVMKKIIQKYQNLMRNKQT